MRNTHKILGAKVGGKGPVGRSRCRLKYIKAGSNFNFYVLLCGNYALKQQTDHSSKACYVLTSASVKQ
jgi:hypothetical protein